MAGKYFSFSDVLSYGWRVMKANLGFFVGLGLLWFIITYTPAIINMVLPYLHLPRPTYMVLYITITILSWVIGIVLSIGIKKIALSFCDERKPTIGTLFDAWDCFWRYLGTAILYGLIVLGGLILLIIPGIIWAIKYSLCFYFVIDKGLDPIEALKASSRTTMGVKWELFALAIVCMSITFLGLLCLLVGIFAAYPVVMVANALVYRQLMAQTPQLAEFGIASPEIQPEPDRAPLPDRQE